MIKLLKIKGSSLVETLVATVIIVVVFGIASVTLHNLMRSAYHSNTTSINNEMNKLKYLYEQGQIDEDYQSNFKNWEIHLEKMEPAKSGSIRLMARIKSNQNKESQKGKILIKTITYVHQD